MSANLVDTAKVVNAYRDWAMEVRGFTSLFPVTMGAFTGRVDLIRAGSTFLTGNEIRFRLSHDSVLEFPPGSTVGTTVSVFTNWDET